MNRSTLTTADIQAAGNDHAAVIASIRAKLNTALVTARAAVNDARIACVDLCSEQVYDVAYAEGHGTDITEFLRDAARMLRAAEAIQIRVTAA